MTNFNYNYRDPRGYEGQVLSTMHNITVVGLNKEGLQDLTDEDLEGLDEDQVFDYLAGIGEQIPYGRGVQIPALATLTEDNNKDFLLAYDDEMPLAGIAHLMHYWERSNNRSVEHGVPSNRQFGVFKRGEILLWSEQAVTRYDPVFCRTALPTPNTDSLIRARFRKTAVADQTVACPNCHWLETTSEPGLVPCWVDFLVGRTTAYAPPPPPTP